MRLFGPTSVRKLEAERDVSALIEALLSDKTDRRREASEALGRLGDPSAGPALVEALRDPSVRDAAAASLLVMAPEVMDVLVMTLRQANPLTREAAADPAVRTVIVQILGHTGDERAVEPLIGALDDVDEVGHAAIEALVNLKDPRAVAALGQRTVRYGVEAIQALGDIGDQDGLAAVVEWVMPQSHVRTSADESAAAIRALGKIGPPEVVVPFIRRIRNHFPGPGTPNGDIIQAALLEAEAALGESVG